MDDLNNWKENLKSDSNQIQWRIISTKDEYLENHREWKMNLCINCGRQEEPANLTSRLPPPINAMHKTQSDQARFIYVCTFYHLNLLMTHVLTFHHMKLRQAQALEQELFWLSIGRLKL